MNLLKSIFPIHRLPRDEIAWAVTAIGLVIGIFVAAVGFWIVRLP